MRAIITAVGHYVPENKLTNADLEKMVDTNDEWIVTRTGIRERRILDKDKGTSYMAVCAAEKALNQRGMSADELDLIIVATVTPDMMFPTTAALVQEALAANNCWGYDLSGGCTGFVCALSTASQFIESGRHKKVMVIGADKMSAITNYQDRNTCILFGDAAGAVILEATDDPDLGVKDFILRVDGFGKKYLYMKAGGSLKPATHQTVENEEHYLYQDGKPVFKQAINGMATTSATLLERNNLSSHDLRLLVPHQANLRIIDAVGKKLKLNPEQVAINIDRYGNTTAATIPLALSEYYQQGDLKIGDWILFTAFGAGFTWGSLLMRWALNGSASD